MAGWGTGSFENEHAQNWLAQLSDLTVDDLTKLFHQASESEYLEAPEASAVVTAAEVLAAAGGAPADILPREISEWISKIEGSPSATLRGLASRAVERVRRNSELRDLWLQAEGLNEWSTSLRDLEKRLGSDTSAT